MKKISIMLLKTSIIIISIIVILYILLYLFQDKLLFHPKKLNKNYQFSFTTDFEEIYFKLKDNSLIHAIHFKSSDNKGLIYYLHGNAGSLEQWGKVSDNYTEKGYDVLMIDYRGYGKSEGNIKNETQLLNDAQEVYNKLKIKYKEEDIIILGHSLGTGPAAFLAKNNHPKKLILLTPYYSMVDVGREHYPFIPKFIFKFKLETHLYIKNITCPISIVHGTSDKLIAYKHSEKIISICKPYDKLYLIENQGHNGINNNLDYKMFLNEILNN